MKDRKEMGSLELAYLGDAVYELEVRSYLTSAGKGAIGELNRRALSFVTAAAQAKAAEAALPGLREEEGIELFIFLNTESNTKRRTVSCVRRFPGSEETGAPVFRTHRRS